MRILFLAFLIGHFLDSCLLHAQPLHTGSCQRKEEEKMSSCVKGLDGEGTKRHVKIMQGLELGRALLPPLAAPTSQPAAITDDV